jgi:hypothetical protein
MPVYWQKFPETSIGFAPSFRSQPLALDQLCGADTLVRRFLLAATVTWLLHPFAFFAKGRQTLKSS